MTTLLAQHRCGPTRRDRVTPVGAQDGRSPPQLPRPAGRPGDVELYHAVKANPHPAVLQVDAPSRDVALARGVADAVLVGAAMLGALLAPWLMGA